MDKRSGVSQRLAITLIENVLSNAERRALERREDRVVPRVSDVYASLPAVTGKIELEYEGELKGAEVVARDLIRKAVGQVFQKYANPSDFAGVVEWFDMGNYLKLPESASPKEVLDSLSKIPGLLKGTALLNVGGSSPAADRVAASEFLLEGLASIRKIARSEERGYHRSEERSRPEVGYEDPMDSKTHLN